MRLAAIRCVFTLATSVLLAASPSAAEEAGICFCSFVGNRSHCDANFQYDIGPDFSGQPDGGVQTAEGDCPVDGCNDYFDLTCEDATEIVVSLCDTPIPWDTHLSVFPPDATDESDIISCDDTGCGDGALSHHVWNHPGGGVTRRVRIAAFQGLGSAYTLNLTAPLGCVVENGPATSEGPEGMEYLVRVLDEAGVEFSDCFRFSTAAPGLLTLDLLPGETFVWAHDGRNSALSSGWQATSQAGSALERSIHGYTRDGGAKLKGDMIDELGATFDLRGVAGSCPASAHQTLGPSPYEP